MRPLTAPPAAVPTHRRGRACVRGSGFPFFASRRRGHGPPTRRRRRRRRPLTILQMEAMFRTVMSLKVAAIPHRHLYEVKTGLSMVERSGEAGGGARRPGVRLSVRLSEAGRAGGRRRRRGGREAVPGGSEGGEWRSEGAWAGRPVRGGGECAPAAAPACAASLPPAARSAPFRSAGRAVAQLHQPHRGSRAASGGRPAAERGPRRAGVRPRPCGPESAAPGQPLAALRLAVPLRLGFYFFGE